MDRPADLKIGALYHVLWFDNAENILQYSERGVFSYPRTPDRIFENFWVIASNGGLNEGLMGIETALSAATFLGASTICPVWDRVQSCTIMDVKELPLYLNWKRGALFDKLLKGICDDPGDL
jgi:hypothetical protein